MCNFVDRRFANKSHRGATSDTLRILYRAAILRFGAVYISGTRHVVFSKRCVLDRRNFRNFCDSLGCPDD